MNALFGLSEYKHLQIDWVYIKKACATQVGGAHED